MTIFEDAPRVTRKKIRGFRESLFGRAYVTETVSAEPGCLATQVVQIPPAATIEF